MTCDSSEHSDTSVNRVTAESTCATSFKPCVLHTQIDLSLLQCCCCWTLSYVWTCFLHSFCDFSQVADEVWSVGFSIPIQVLIFCYKYFASFSFPFNFTKFHCCFLLTQMTENEWAMCFLLMIVAQLTEISSCADRLSSIHRMLSCKLQQCHKLENATVS